jgi:ABC-type multidrug transport system ATPase subunit
MLTALNSVSINLHKGETLGLLGPNGAGKSTAFNILSTNIPASSGSILFHNKTINNNKEFYKNTGIVFQEDIMWDDVSVLNHFRIFS